MFGTILRATRSTILALACLLIGAVEADAAGSSLLGGPHGGHYWFRYCEGEPDDTPLPPDPRSQVVPTSDKAVVFNVAWYGCLDTQPSTCGELRTLQAAGGRILRGDGLPGAGWQFSGDHA